MVELDEGRGHARNNPTVAAFMRRGIDSALAERLKTGGHTFASLQEKDATALKRLGLSPEIISNVRKGGRPPVPFDNLVQVLWCNRSTCCVCRQSGAPIILHHIKPWAKSRDHSVENLAVLCLNCHGKAHRKGDLEHNLSERELREHKAKWEEEVRHLDPKAILDASRVDGFHWWWFNHGRLFELAGRLGIDPTKLPPFNSAKRRGMVDREGFITAINTHEPYLYIGGDGNFLYFYVTALVEAVISKLAIYNISNDLDPGFLGRVVSPGDFILVQGKHLFKRIGTKERGVGQASEVRREANCVRVNFTIDRWEAVANSSWACWLTGAKQAASIVQVRSVERDGVKLHLRCTGYAMGSPMEGFATRSYMAPDCPIGGGEIEYLEEDWLQGFGEDD